MGNCATEPSAETRLDLRCLSSQELLDGQEYATIPLMTVRAIPGLSPEYEEEVHSLFEEAISERIWHVSLQVERLARSGGLNGGVWERDTSVIGRVRLSARVGHRWWEPRQRIAAICLKASLFLLGFDLMCCLLLVHRLVAW